MLSGQPRFKLFWIFISQKCTQYPECRKNLRFVYRMCTFRVEKNKLYSCLYSMLCKNAVADGLPLWLQDM